MLRITVRSRTNLRIDVCKRFVSSASDIRRTFLQFFHEEYAHKVVKSSSVVPMFDRSLPFVNTGMNQFKSIFLGDSSPQHSCVVNTQKCIEVDDKNLSLVGTDGFHHTFFEMLGNRSFGDYYKAEACKMAWELLTGPYQLKPENLVVTYFSGEKTLGLNEDRECRDIWKDLGLPESHIKPSRTVDDIWEKSYTVPWGPSTKIYHLNADGSLTELWNIMFIQYSRESDGSIRELCKHHVDTGMRLEQMAAVLQDVPYHYDTDLFMPIIRTIEKKSKNVPNYASNFGSSASVDNAYRCLADHARMLSICLADGLCPATCQHLKQIMHKSFKISSDIFKCKSGLVTLLYDQVSESLSHTYPELNHKQKDAKTIIEHEEQSYIKLRTDLCKKVKDLWKRYPEVETLGEVKSNGFIPGYKYFKQAMSKSKSTLIPGDVVLKLYNTYGIQEDLIEKIAQINNYSLNKEEFEILLKRHKSKHKENNNNQNKLNLAIDKLNQNGCHATNDQHKYDFVKEHNEIKFPWLKSELLAILTENCDCVNELEVNSKDTFYLVTKDTNFHCENGGLNQDGGKIQISNDTNFNVTSVLKVKDIVFHKGIFVQKNSQKEIMKIGDFVVLILDRDKRLSSMRNRTGIHLLYSAIRKVMPNSVTCQVNLNMTNKELVISLKVYGEEKLTQNVLLDAQNLIRESICLNTPVETRILDRIALPLESDVVSSPGEIYTETNLRLVQIQNEHIYSRQLCSGIHVPSTGDIGHFCITNIKGAGTNSPSIKALTGDAARQVIELLEKARHLQQNAMELDQVKLKHDITFIRQSLAALEGGAPAGEHAQCLAVLEALNKQIKKRDQLSLDIVAQKEMRSQSIEAQALGRPFIVHFLMCSYLMESAGLVNALSPCKDTPAMVFGCANGIIKVACQVPKNSITTEFNAERWLTCVLPIFNAKIAPNKNGVSLKHFAAISGTKVSLINCESQVHDAMKIAVTFAKQHTTKQNSSDTSYRDYDAHTNGPERHRQS